MAPLSSCGRERKAVFLSEGQRFWAVRGLGSRARVAAAWASTPFAVFAQLSWRVCRETASQPEAPTASDLSSAWSRDTKTASTGTYVVLSAFVLYDLCRQVAQSPSGEAGGRATGQSTRHRPPPAKQSVSDPLYPTWSGGFLWSCCLSFDRTPRQQPPP